MHTYTHSHAHTQAHMHVDTCVITHTHMHAHIHTHTIFKQNGTSNMILSFKETMRLLYPSVQYQKQHFQILTHREYNVWRDEDIITKKRVP